MTDIDTRALDRELKRGSAELLILSLLEARPRHGYEIGRLIDQRSGGEAPHTQSYTPTARDGASEPRYVSALSTSGEVLPGERV